MANQSRVGSSNGSPYYGPMCRLKFKGGEIACVPWDMIDKYPGFAALVYTQQAIGKPYKFDVTGRVGHTIVHFLFTGVYETLPLPPDDKTKKPSGAFIEALEVYHQAVITGLEELAELATQEIDQQGGSESFASIVKGVNGVRHVFEGDKTWLVGYLADRATMDDEEVTVADIEELEDMDGDHKLVEILLEANMKLKFQRQKAEQSEASSME